MQHTGYIIVLAYPETVVRTATKEISSKIWPLFGVGGKHSVMAGHAAFLLVSKNTGAVNYFDFGRYVTSEGMGRARSEKTDCELAIPISAVFDRDAIVNLEEILFFVEKHPEKTHGAGRMIASVNAYINYEKAFRFVENFQKKGEVPYGAFLKKGSNCARFVTDVLLYATYDQQCRKKLRRSKFFTPSPIGNVVNGKTEEKIVEVHRQKIRSYKYDSVLKEHRNYFFNKVSQKTHTHGTLLPMKECYDSSKAQWLSGVGSGAWFEIEKCVKNCYTISRRGAKGELHVKDLFVVNQCGFEIEKPYVFLHGSHCSLIKVQQNRKVYVFRRYL